MSTYYANPPSLDQVLRGISYYVDSHYVYELRDIFGAVVYIGMTDDLPRREAEHRDDEQKVFAHMVAVLAFADEASAKTAEMQRLFQHKLLFGQYPLYNRTSYG